MKISPSQYVTQKCLLNKLSPCVIISESYSIYILFDIFVCSQSTVYFYEFCRISAADNGVKIQKMSKNIQRLIH